MNSPPPVRRLIWLYAVTVFVSAFLIFQVQPLISKYILPWFGGTPGVWSVCLLFFQSLLFAGYAYAHLVIEHLTPRRQTVLHLALLVLAVALLPIAPHGNWKPNGSEDPTWRILCLLAASVGLPYFILSSTGPLVQAWFSRAHPESSPYRLYALSNIGSVLGLVTYPFVVEPLWTTETQAGVWSFGFVVFAVCCTACAWFAVRRGGHASSPATRAANGRAAIVAPTRVERGLWFGLSACASIMLLATTNQVCLDVAVIPFLWVLPLSIYLVSFILCFGSERWYPRGLFAIGLAVSMACLVVLLFREQTPHIVFQIAVYCGALFFCCMVCHGELVKLKPHPRHLTSFYLASAAGGAAGGVLVGLVAPHVFHRFIELHIGMLSCCLLALVAYFRDRNWVLYRGRPAWAWALLVLAWLGLAKSLRSHAGEVHADEVTVRRNFFGVLRVAMSHVDQPDAQSRLLIHGRTLHGLQFTSPSKQSLPTTYYGPDSGVGLALKMAPRTPGLRVGVVGLGTGTLAAYAQPGDCFRFYEIDPDVIRLAQEHFTFLKDCRGRCELVAGDARLSLEREPSQRFDVLVLDAFSSDAIPVHLLTREAWDIYRRHLRPDGTLAIHISNRYFDLRPVIDRLSEHAGWSAIKVAGKANPETGQRASEWMLVSGRRELFDAPELRAAADPSLRPPRVVPLWTDAYSNVIQVLK
jgi:SAM-dependent methyltransferase